jgi:hypothetical protein
MKPSSVADPVEHGLAFDLKVADAAALAARAHDAVRVAVLLPRRNTVLPRDRTARPARH